MCLWIDTALIDMVLGTCQSVVSLHTSEQTGEVSLHTSKQISEVSLHTSEQSHSRAQDNTYNGRDHAVCQIANCMPLIAHNFPDRAVMRSSVHRSIKIEVVSP